MAYPGVTKTYAIQAGRELRVIVGADKIDDKQTESPVSYTHLKGFFQQSATRAFRCAKYVGQNEAHCNRPSHIYPGRDVYKRQGTSKSIQRATFRISCGVNLVPPCPLSRRLIRLLVLEPAK